MLPRRYALSVLPMKKERYLDWQKLLPIQKSRISNFYLHNFEKQKSAQSATKSFPLKQSQTSALFSKRSTVR